MSMFVPRWKFAMSGLVGLAVCAVASVTYGQQLSQAVPLRDLQKPRLTKPTYGNFFMSTTIGSFKMLEYNDQGQPEGHFVMSFTGTVLVDTSDAVKHDRNLKTTISTTGNVVKALDYHGREVYHGTGTITVDGGWHALQFFGRDMKAQLNGYAVFRLAGEFDKNLETGYYWYDDGKKWDWGTAGNQPTCPKIVMGIQKARVKINGKSG